MTRTQALLSVLIIVAAPAWGEIALKYYPEDPTANLNAAAAAIDAGDYAKAKEYLPKAGETPEANNLRGIVATAEGDFAAAKEWFGKAGALPEATKNLLLLRSSD